ncbi:hypothetical protein E2562_003003, partial [Oryza meyeriana var. granulata]
VRSKSMTEVMHNNSKMRVVGLILIAVPALWIRYPPSSEAVEKGRRRSIH